MTYFNLLLCLIIFVSIPFLLIIKFLLGTLFDDKE
jgi:hypothetical protein